MIKGLFNKVHTVFLPVRNLDKSIDWYVENLGFELESRWENEQEKGAYFIVYRGKIKLGLIQSLSSTKHPEGFRSAQYIKGFKGATRFNINTPNARNTYQLLEQKGVMLTPFREGPPTHCFDVIDPDDNYLGVVEELDMPGSPYYAWYLAVYPKLDKDELFDGIGGFYVPVTSLEQGIEWYTQHLHMKFLESWERNADLQFLSEQGGLGLIQTNELEPVRYIDSHNAYAEIDSPNPEAAYQSLIELGVKVSRINQGNHVAYEIEDPYGNILRFKKAT